MSRSSGRLLAACVVAGVFALLSAASDAADPAEGGVAGQQAAPPGAPKLPFRTDRPRLLFTKDQLPTLRKRCEGPYAEDYKAMTAWADEQVKLVLSPAFEEKLRAIPPIKNKYARQGQFKALVAPLETFGLLWHLTGRESYAKAGRRLLVACFESDDVGSFAPVPEAYDLFYDALTPEERLNFGRKMLEFVQTKAPQYPEASLWGRPKILRLIALYGTGIEEADVNARLAKVVEYERNIHLAGYARMARSRGGWTESLGGNDPIKLFTAFWQCWQNATGDKIFETNPGLYGMGNWIMYSIMDFSRKPEEWRVAPVGYFMNTDNHNTIFQQTVDLCAYPARDSVGTWLAERLYQPPAGQRNPMWRPWPEAQRRPTPVWQRILWKDPEVRPVEPRELPETTIFEGWGWVSMRSSWQGDGVFAHFICGPKGRSEPSQLDDGSFIIYHKGLLAIDDAAKGRQKGGLYGQMSLAHNTITVLDPQEKILSCDAYAFIRSNRVPFPVNDGGQTFHPNRPGERRVRGFYNTLAWRGQITAYETGSLYDYVCADVTRSYSAAKLKSFTRQFLFLKPDLFVVFDRVVSTNKNFRKRWHLQVRQEPVIEGDLVRVDQGGGRLWCRAVFPEKAVIKKVQGAKLETPDGGYELPAAWKKYGTNTWRIDVGPREAREEDVFLHVLQATDAQAPVSFQAEAIRKGDRIGVKVSRGDRTYEVLFDATGPAAGAITASEPGKILTRADLASDVRDTYWNWRDDPRFNAWMTDDRFRYLIPRQDRERFRAGGANAGMRTTSEAVGAAR